LVDRWVYLWGFELEIWLAFLLELRLAQMLGLVLETPSDDVMALGSD
jgi:hypothetical protein